VTTICLLEPYDAGSHGAWIKGYVAHSVHRLVALTMDGRFWKWRMHGGAITLARRYRSLGIRPDLLLATDMLDLTTFLALTRDVTHATPVALYMHENQLTYPPRPGERRDLHYGFINYASMLSADRVFFNSRYHLESWFDELPRLLRHFPDYRDMATIDRLRERSEVLPLGLSLRTLDVPRADANRKGPLLIVWNHRWEYDKDPGVLFAALYALRERGVPFRVAILGERFVSVPPEFEDAQRGLADHIVQFGYVEHFDDYARWLWRADIVVSTAIQESFGASVVEAMYCDCLPLLPDRLAYPQFIPADRRDLCLYRTEQELVDRLAWMAGHLETVRAITLRDEASRYDWSHMAPRYDSRLQRLAESRHHR